MPRSQKQRVHTPVSGVLDHRQLQDMGSLGLTPDDLSIDSYYKGLQGHPIALKPRDLIANIESGHCGWPRHRCVKMVAIHRELGRLFVEKPAGWDESWEVHGGSDRRAVEPVAVGSDFVEVQYMDKQYMVSRGGNIARKGDRVTLAQPENDPQYRFFHPE
ncbi:hypothetical protein MRB53_040914 [Persea americana]|nr:hypothetical protein MRB53_040914 [Persea americana]